MAGYSVTFSVVDEATKKIDDINKRIAQLRAPLERQQKALARFVDTSGLAKMAEGFKELARSALDAFESLSRIAPPLAAITGATTIAGMAALVAEFGAWGAQLRRNADDINATSKDLYEMQRAFRMAGGDAATMTQGLKDITQAAGDAALGRNAPFAVFAHQAGIELFNANGQVRNATELLPEMLKDINSTTNAYDRHNKALAYGGETLYRIAQRIRLSGKTIEEWRKDLQASGLDLADVIKRSEDYERAVGELNDAFEEVGVELATQLTPLIKDLAKWLREHPNALRDATKELADALKFVVNHATLLLGIFATLWGVKTVAQIFAVVQGVRDLNVALAATGPAGAGLAGILGRLGIAGAAIGGILAAIGIGRATGVVTGKGGPQWDPAWGPRPEGFPEPEKSEPDTIDRVLNPVRRFFGLPTNEPGGAPPAQPTAKPVTPSPASYTPAPPAGTAPANDNAAGARRLAAPRVPAPAGTGEFLKRQEGLVLHAYSDVGGYPTFGYGHLISAKERAQGYIDTSTGQVPLRGATKQQAEAVYNEDVAKREQQITAKAPGYANLNANQKEAVMSYYFNTGRLPRNFAANVAAGDTDAIAESLRTGIATVHGRTFAPLARRRREEAELFRTAPKGDALPAPGAPGANGSVDVTVTHKNAPAGTSVGATGTGDVNVAPVRTEWQDMAAV